MGGGLGGPQSFMTTGILAAIYSIIAIIYFILSLFLYRFAGKMQVALQATDQDSFNAALYNLKLVYRISGIIVLVYLAFVALAMVFGVGMAAFS
jgi:Na+/proline symporter